jgi:hypothetical protein
MEESDHFLIWNEICKLPRGTKKPYKRFLRHDKQTQSRDFNSGPSENAVSPTRRPRSITQTSRPIVHVKAADTCIIHVYISTEGGKKLRSRRGSHSRWWRKIRVSGIWRRTHWYIGMTLRGQFTASVFKTDQQRYFVDYPEGGWNNALRRR